ncbi:uncharacterized protein METZ01_LOCUS312721 [marine metagenome]|jgi:hypothetical protein|uniref:Uncharacterized protein n=1 Tax=marine metagenome TaxID=408172 RepID=A0A382NHX5_9ZZZZ
MPKDKKLVPSLLYTTEAEKSKQDVEKDLEIPDPEDGEVTMENLVAEAQQLNDGEAPLD